MSHWLDDAARGLAQGRHSRRHVLVRGGGAFATALAGSALAPLRALAERPCPAGWERCGDRCYDPSTHECCGGPGDIYCAKSTGGCCGSTCGEHCGPDLMCCYAVTSDGRPPCYDPKTEVCCMGISEGTVCSAAVGCCGRESVDGTCTDQYCGPHELCCPAAHEDFCYDSRTHFCCAGSPHAHPCKLGETCCGTKGCCAKSQVCCGSGDDAACCDARDCLDLGGKGKVCCHSVFDEAHEAEIHSSCFDGCCAPGLVCCGTKAKHDCCKPGQCDQANGTCKGGCTQEKPNCGAPGTIANPGSDCCIAEGAATGVCCPMNDVNIKAGASSCMLNSQGNPTGTCCPPGQTGKACGTTSNTFYKCCPADTGICCGDTCCAADQNACTTDSQCTTV